MNDKVVNEKCIVCGRYGNVYHGSIVLCTVCSLLVDRIPIKEGESLIDIVLRLRGQTAEELLRDRAFGLY